jgi:hypothetical protein
MARAKRPRRSSRAARPGGKRPRRAASSSAKRRKAGAARKRAVKKAKKPTRRTSKARPAAKAPLRKSKSKPKATARAATTARNVEAVAPGKVPRLDRVRRTLGDETVVPTPPSSLNMERHGSAARSGRAEMEDNLRKRGSISPGITGGDVDADYENAYFSGDEAPGGDNPTPDQDVVDDIGRALGVQYDDNEELKSGDKVSERDKHRWELDPASSEDYKDRD